VAFTKLVSSSASVQFLQIVSPFIRHNELKLFFSYELQNIYWYGFRHPFHLIFKTWILGKAQA